MYVSGDFYYDCDIHNAITEGAADTKSDEKCRKRREIDNGFDFEDTRPLVHTRRKEPMTVLMIEAKRANGPFSVRVGIEVIRLAMWTGRLTKHI